MTVSRANGNRDTKTNHLYGLFDLIEVFMLTHRFDIIALSLYVGTASKSVETASISRNSSLGLMGACFGTYDDVCS